MLGCKGICNNINLLIKSAFTTLSGGGVSEELHFTATPPLPYSLLDFHSKHSDTLFLIVKQILLASTSGDV